MVNGDRAGGWSICWAAAISGGWMGVCFVWCSRVWTRVTHTFENFKRGRAAQRIVIGKDQCEDECIKNAVVRWGVGAKPTAPPPPHCQHQEIGLDRCTYECVTCAQLQAQASSLRQAPSLEQLQSLNIQGSSKNHSADGCMNSVAAKTGGATRTP